MSHLISVKMFKKWQLMTGFAKYDNQALIYIVSFPFRRFSGVYFERN